MAQASNQLSSVLSQQLSGLIGRCFSQTDEGFEAAAPSQQAPAAGSNTAATKQQPLHVQVHRPSRHSTDSAHDDSSYWGSPVKHDSSAGNTATCSLAATTAEMVPPCSTAPSSTATCHQQQQSSTTATSSIPAPAAQAQPAEAACTPPAPVAAAPASQAVSFSSFQEISRMISHGEDSSPLARPSSIKTSMPPGLAARLLDEQASWGTPQENSPWGTPREQQLGSNATNTPTSGSVDQQGSNPGHHFSGPAVHKLMFGGEQLHSRLEAAVSGKQLAEHLEQQPQQQQPISLPAAAAVLPADVLGVSKAAPAKPAAAPAAPTAGELEPAAAVAAAVAAVDAAAAETEADSFGDLDFTIPVAMDVQPRPHSRGSSRIREVYRVSGSPPAAQWCSGRATHALKSPYPSPMPACQHVNHAHAACRSAHLIRPHAGCAQLNTSALCLMLSLQASNTSASNTGMVVDVPQPLTSRHTGLMRSPGRSLPAPSDPGHMGTASAFSHAASMSAAQVSASVGGAAGFEQRRTATNIGPGLGSFGGSHAASRRMSRNASSRLNADQDWALLGPDGQLLQQQLAAMQVPQQRVSLGQVLHAPGVGSRRTSRTLSGEHEGQQHGPKATTGCAMQQACHCTGASYFECHCAELLPRRLLRLLFRPSSQAPEESLCSFPLLINRVLWCRKHSTNTLQLPAAACCVAAVCIGRLALDQDAAAVLMEQLDDSEPDVLSRPVAPAAPGLDTIISRRQSTSNGRGTPDSDGFGFSEFEGLEPLVPPEEAAAAALTEAAAAAAAAAAATDGGAADGMNSSASSSMGALHHHRVHRRSARSLGVPPPVNMGHRPSMRLSDQDPGHHGLAALPAMTAAAVAAAAAARAHTSAASGLPGPRIVGYDVVSTPLPEEEDAAGMEVEGQAANSSSTPAPAAAGTPVRLGSRTNSTGAAAAGSPLQSATGGSSTRAASGSLDGSCRSSKRSIPSIFQAAAAVAAAAEAAAAAAVGYALGGRDRTSGEQQALDKAAQGAEADGKVQAAAAVEQVEDPEQLQESVFAAPSFLKQRLGGGGEGLGSVDSFTCPPFMPLAGSITVTGSRSGLSVAASNTSSAVSSSNGSQPGPVAGSGDTAMAAELAAADASLGQAVAAGLAGAPAFPGHAYAMAAATAAGAIAADGELHATGVYGSPAANIGSFIAAAAGSPSAATAALLRRQQLLSSEGSEWGSGALGSHLHLSTSGIDSPTGSAVFRLGGNSPHPLDTCDSAGGGASVAPGELTAALESLAVQSGCGTGGSKPIGIGASRMAREAAAAAGHAGSLTNQGVSLPAGSGYSNGPVGAAALLLGTQGAAVLNKGLAAGLSEITPAADDEEPGGGMISAKYPSDSGNNPAAGAVFFRLAGGPAPGDTTTATAQQGAGEMALQRSSSSGSGAAISKVLGKIAVGKAPLLPKPAAQSSSSSTLSRQVAAGSGGVAASQGSDACSNIGSEAAPPSYVESVGGDADDEQSPYGHHAAVSSRRVWPAQYAAETEAAAAASGDDNASIRQSAALGRASHTAGLAASQRQEQQVVEEEDAGSPERPSTGLVRRTPHTSRTPSQSLPPGMRPSLESLGLLGGRSFHYEDCDDLPLMRGTVTSVAEQVRAYSACPEHDREGPLWQSTESQNTSPGSCFVTDKEDGGVLRRQGLSQIWCVASCCPDFHLALGVGVACRIVGDHQSSNLAPTDLSACRGPGYAGMVIQHTACRGCVALAGSWCRV